MQYSDDWETALHRRDVAQPARILPCGDSALTVEFGDAIGNEVRVAQWSDRRACQPRAQFKSPDRAN